MEQINAETKIIEDKVYTANVKGVEIKVLNDYTKFMTMVKEAEKKQDEKNYLKG